jgi:ribonuclease P protein component
MSRITRTISSFKPREVEAFFQNARCVFKDAGLTLLCAPSQAETGRVLVITPRRIGNAPARNKIRRQLRALFYETTLYALRTDCAVIVRAPALAYTFEKLKTICVNALKPHAS